MGPNNKDRVTQALEVLRQELYPYAENKLKETYGDDWISKVTGHLQKHQKSKQPVEDIVCEDVAVLLGIVNREWDKVFKNHLEQSARAFVAELIGVRNKWAHKPPFSNDDTYRAGTVK
jgi:ribonuclease-3